MVQNVSSITEWGHAVATWDNFEVHSAPLSIGVIYLSECTRVDCILVKPVTDFSYHLLVIVPIGNSTCIVQKYKIVTIAPSLVLIYQLTLSLITFSPYYQILL